MKFPINFEEFINTHPSDLAKELIQSNPKLNPFDMGIIIRTIVDISHFWVTNTSNSKIVSNQNLLTDMLNGAGESDNFEETIKNFTNMSQKDRAEFVYQYRAIRALRAFKRFQEVDFLQKELNPYDILEIQHLNPNPIVETVTHENIPNLDWVDIQEPFDGTKFDWEELVNEMKKGKDNEAM